MSMKDLSEIVKRYTIGYDQKIKNVTVHLANNFNIFSYTYFKIEEDGRFITLSNNPEQLDFYYAEKYYLQNPYLLNPHLLRSGFVLTTMTQDEKYLNTVNTSLKRFQMDNTFLMLEKRGGKVEGFLFATRPTKEDAIFNYLNYFDTLKKFNCYFIREMTPVLGKMRADRFNLKLAKGMQFLERKEGLPLACKDTISQDFLKTISPLSPQEVRCLDLFRMGYSAQATASIMDLSRRTVEHYFENIKNKLVLQIKSFSSYF
jgi:DNA-binding CsgD family transcriptional regulator